VSVLSAGSLTSGTLLVILGEGYHVSAPLLTGVALLGLALGLGLVGFAAAAVRYRQRGGYVCWMYQFRGGRLHHLHWPRAGITACKNSAGLDWSR
jgi:hypothetical protein